MKTFLLSVSLLISGLLFAQTECYQWPSSPVGSNYFAYSDTIITGTVDITGGKKLYIKNGVQIHDVLGDKDSKIYVHNNVLRIDTFRFALIGPVNPTVVECFVKFNAGATVYIDDRHLSNDTLWYGWPGLLGAVFMRSCAQILSMPDILKKPTTTVPKHWMTSTRFKFIGTHSTTLMRYSKFCTFNDFKAYLRLQGGTSMYPYVVSVDGSDDPAVQVPIFR